MGKSIKPIRFLLTGGGTGGHLFPALAAAEEVCLRCPGSKVLFIGTRRKMDKSSLSGYGFDMESIFCYGLKGKSIPNLIKAIAVLPISFFQSIYRIAAFRPDVVLGVGGYVTGPVIAAAKLLGKKTVIHEQNSIPGLANRKLGKLADKICISLPQSAKYFSSAKTVFTGNPVRRSIIELAAKSKVNSGRKKKTLLILGGSQGAHRINQLVVEALCEHGVITELKVIHQTGNADCDEVRSKYRESGVENLVEPFFQDMAEIYDQADLLVSRAGATTLAELAVLGKPAILVPYPFAADNHQQKNAEFYEEGGGCLNFVEGDLTGKKLADQINSIFSDPQQMTTMSDNIKKLGKPRAAANIVDVCLESMST